MYIKKQDGNWSNNVIKENTYDYGLGYLEGQGAATSNRSVGLQGTGVTINVIENTATKIRVRSTQSVGGTDFSETWIFWAAKPYFQSDASALVTQSGGYLTNQLQFAWMINNNLANAWYGTDKNGGITQFTSVVMQPIHSPNLNTHPLINWQFTGENVSLGLIFTDISDPRGVVGETGDWQFEYQIDWNLGSGLLGSPVNQNYTRSLTTTYYTANQATNTNIANYSQNSYQGATSQITQNPVTQSVQYVNNPASQNLGNGSSLLSAPYFLVRQNTQNRHNAIEHPQYETSIYAPLYKNQQAIHSGSYDFQDQLQYSLNYSNDTQDFTYGTIADSNAINGSTTSIQMNATSSDSKLAYSSIFETYSDSDKLKIYGNTSNASSTALVKNIYMMLSGKGNSSFEAETATPASAITSTLSTNDSLWTNYNYGYDSGTTLIYQDKGENVPPLSIPINLSDGAYRVTAYVQERTEGSINYQYSTDNITYHTFTVATSTSNGIRAVDLGILNISGGVFYINDDDSASVGPTGAWAGWDKISLQPTIQSLGSNVYDFHASDDIYTQTGIAVKVNSPTNNIVINNGTDLLVYLYSTTTAQTLTNFNYPLDIEVYPHTGWLNSSSDFISLHSQNSITYDKRSLYIPGGIHSGRSNSIYSSGAISYSSDPYNSSTLVNMTIVPSQGTVSTTINSWNISGDYSKNWTEENTVSTSTTVHTIGDLKANTYYNVLVDSTQYASMLTDGTGQGTFTYTGGYSTHTFNVTADTTAPTTPSSSPTANIGGGATQTFTWSASSDASSGLAKYQLYVDGGLNQDNITGTSASASGFSCGAHTWYVRAVDNAGNIADSGSQSFSVSCGGGGPIMAPGSFTFNVPTPRMQTVTNGVVTYLDEKVSTPTSTPSLGNKASKLEVTPSFTHPLKRGAKGNDVSALQTFLKKDSTVYPEGLATGFFGPATERAIKRFQEKYGIAYSNTPGYGTVGPKTRAKLNSLIK